MSALVWFALLAGLGLGWILCDVIQVSPLVKTIRDLKKLGYLYLPEKPKGQQPDSLPPVKNET